MNSFRLQQNASHSDFAPLLSSNHMLTFYLILVSEFNLSYGADFTETDYRTARSLIFPLLVLSLQRLV